MYYLNSKVILKEKYNEINISSKGKNKKIIKKENMTCTWIEIQKSESVPIYKLIVHDIID